MRCGERVAFTRSEKGILAMLAQNPGRLLSRDQILDALSGPGSDKADRNIDFLINRLRRKLADDARSPRYIATRYGEGYVWIGRAGRTDAGCAGAYLVVGPLLGLDNLGDPDVGIRFASHMASALQAQLPAEQLVTLAPDCPPASAFTEGTPALGMALTFFEESGVANCVATMRQFKQGRILAISRIAASGSDPAEALRTASKLGRKLLDDTWRTLSTELEAGAPLPLAMHLATPPTIKEMGCPADSRERLSEIEARHVSRNLTAWKQDETRLLRLREAQPDDATLKIMHATHIHSKYIMLGHSLFLAGIDERAEDEDQIEALVLAALPQVQSQPEHAIMAAKLLHFLDRGYYELARDLTEAAYCTSVSAANSLAIVGQLRAYGGETEAALRCIDQALNLVERGTKMHLYVLTIKMQALRSIADFERLRAAKRELYSVSAAAMLFYEPLFANPDRLSIRAKAVTMMLTRKKASALLLMNNYVSARLFRNPAHRMNNILTPLTLIVRRFGKTAVPEEIVTTYPGLLDRFA